MIKKFSILLALVFMVAPVNVSAVSDEELFFRRNGILFYDPNSPRVSSGNGCLTLAIPTINDVNQFASAINRYIEEKNPTSPFIGMGSYFVSGGIRAGINPMAVVGFAYKESALGRATPHDQDTGEPSFNAFGLTATSSQPHVLRAPNGVDSNGNPHPPRRWYKFPSWEKSLDGELAVRDHPTYLRDNYLNLGLVTFSQVISKYAPSSDGNDPNGYALQMEERIQEMIVLAGDAISCGGGGSSLGANIDCPPNLEGPDVSRFGYYKMPESINGEYVIYAAQERRYGSKELVCALYTAARTYRTAYPDSSKLYIGDLNAGAPHKSHTNGIAVDVDAGGTIAAADYTGAAKGTYNTQATIKLGKAFIDTGVIKNIWWCEPGSKPKAKGVPLKQANLSGDDGSMAAIRQYAESQGNPVTLYCIAGHQNHFHIDIKFEYKGEKRHTP